MALVRSSGKSAPQVKQELGVAEQGLRGWLKQAAIDAGRGQPDQTTTDERAELQRLRRENQVLRQERGILKESRSLLREGDDARRFAFIDGEKAINHITMLCHVLDIARSDYSDWRRRGISARVQVDQVFTELALAVLKMAVAPDRPAQPPVRQPDSAGECAAPLIVPRDHHCSGLIKLHGRFLSHRRSRVVAL